MNKKVYKLVNDTARLMAGRGVQLAPEGYVITISEPTRSSEQNSLLHALLTEISGKLEWAGKKRDVDTWKRLLTAAWCRATNQAVELLPAIDGAGVDIVYLKTSKLSKNECGELIEFIDEWYSNVKS